MVDVVVDFPAGAEASEPVEQGDGLFHDPAVDAEAGAVFCAAAGEDGGDGAGADLAAVFVVVVGAVGVGPFRAVLGSACSGWVGFDRRDLVDQRQQLGDVVAVRAGQRHRERDPGGVHQYVVFAACAGPVYRVGAGVGPPLSARTADPSIAARTSRSG